MNSKEKLYFNVLSLRIASWDAKDSHYRWEENDNYDDDDNDNDNDNDSPWQSLPNCTHNELNVPSRRKNTLEMTLVGRWQHRKQLNIW